MAERASMAYERLHQLYLRSLEHLADCAWKVETSFGFEPMQWQRLEDPTAAS